MKRSLLAAMTLPMALAAGCDGCKKTERASPLRYVDKAADAVLEIRDIGAVGELPAYIDKHLGTVITKTQVASLREELLLSTGFDPTTAEGLMKAGLAKKGPVAASLAADGSSALWIVPVDDEKKLRPILDRQLKSRAGDQVTTEKVGKVSLTTYSTAFGADKIPAASYGLSNGFLFLGFGRTAAEFVKKAVVLTPKDSVVEHPEYRALVTALGNDYHARLIAPGGGDALSRMTRLASRLVPQIPAIDMPLDEEVEGAGFAFTLADKAMRVKGRIRMSEVGTKAMTAVFTPKAKIGPGVLSLDVPGAALHVQAAGDVPSLTAMLAPEGSQARARLDVAFGRVNSDVKIDIEKEIFPLLSGHAAMAIGIGSLEGKSFREVVGNPRGLLWTTLGFGAEDPKALAEREQNLDEGLAKRGMAVTTRKFNNIQMRSITSAGGGPTLVETFVLPKAWVFSNEPVIGERIILNGGGRDRLNGQGGLAVELRVNAVVGELSKFDRKSLPLLYRGIVAKGLDVLKLVDRAELVVKPAPDGLTMSGALVFAK